jgi:predicted GH43/DUF377 family glycosyl hydrolase
MIPIKKEALLISPKDIKPTSKKLEVVGVFNPAAARLPNGDIILYVRVAEKMKDEASEDRKYYYVPRCVGKKTCKIQFDKFKKEEVQLKSSSDIVFKDETKRLLFISHFRRIVLDKTGFRIKSIDKRPSFSGLKSNGELGVEDPRIAKIGEKYIMTYVSLSRQGNISTSLAVSKDCMKWDRKGMIFSEQNKDVSLFPEKFNKFYYAFNRPESGFQFTPPHMWISSSKDLVNWGHNRPLTLSRKGKWDYERVGAGPPPVKTEKGWLLLYHGVIERDRNAPVVVSGSSVVRTSASYEVGAALFDLKSPRNLIAKSPEPIIAPAKSYEKSGFVNNVVFPTGLIMDENGKDLLLFSGGADSVTTVKKISLKDVLKAMKKA